MRSDSILKRYFFKFISSLISGLFNFIVLAVFPRYLGPVSFGQYSYVVSFFQQSIGFLESGATIGLFTKLSQRNDEQGLLSFTVLFSFCILLFVFGWASILMYLPISHWVWPDVPKRYILLGFVYAALLWSSGMLLKISDAYGLTVKTETVRFIHRIIFFGVLGGFVVLVAMHLLSFFIFQIAYVLSYVLFLWIILKIHKVHFFRGITKLDYKLYFKELWQYCRPLYSYNIIATFCGLWDIWLLQKSSGSAAQGIYGFAFQLAAVSFLFSSTMVPILTRELSRAFYVEDFKRLKYLFEHYLPPLYFITSSFCVFIAFHAKTITIFVGGDAFSSALIVVVVMAFYPLHQTFGQLSGSVFYATNRTRQYRNIGICCALFGAVASYFIIAPQHRGGFHLGAIGLASKVVAIQVISVNVSLFFNAKYIGASFWQFFYKQILLLALPVLLGLFSWYFGLFFNVWVSMFVYVLLLALVFSIFSKIFFGISMSELIDRAGLLKRIRSE